MCKLWLSEKEIQFNSIQNRDPIKKSPVQKVTNKFDMKWNNRKLSKMNDANPHLHKDPLFGTETFQAFFLLIPYVNVHVMNELPEDGKSYGIA